MPKMPKSKGATVSSRDWLSYVLCAAVAAWLALYVDRLLVSKYATARIWETWIQAGSSLALWLPPVAFAFMTGVAVGVIIGLVFPKHVSVKIATIAAILQFAEASFSGNIGPAVVAAIGLILGAMPSRLTR